MGNFDRGGNRGGFNKGGFGGKPSFNRKPFGNDRDRDQQMFKATCSECGKQCEVPFKPVNGKPVFCTDCFNAKRDSTDSRGGRDSFDRAPRREFNDRPSFRADAPRPAFTAASNDETKKQLAEISSKLDRLVSAIEKMSAPTMATPVAKPVAKEVAPAKVVKPVKEKAPAKKVAPKKAAPKKAPAKKKK